MAGETRVKIHFRLKPEGDNYPPAEVERLWAHPCDAEVFEIENIPFFVNCLSYHDKVIAKHGPTGNLEYVRHVEYSKHSTLRVVVFEESNVPNVRETLKRLGCSSELSHIPKLIAVDVPPSVKIESVLSCLENEEKQGVLEYEEAAIWK
jgi:hypothetical protein